MRLAPEQFCQKFFSDGDGRRCLLGWALEHVGHDRSQLISDQLETRAELRDLVTAVCDAGGAPHHDSLFRRAADFNDNSEPEVVAAAWNAVVRAP